MLDPWPFSTTPDAARAKVWAGRPEALRRLNGRVASWKRRPASDITVLWADFGQGKTHSLLHLAGQVRAELGNATVHYVQLPPLTTGSPFVALYRQMMHDFPLGELGRKVYEYYEASPASLLIDPVRDRSIVQLLWLVGSATPASEVALRWLRAEPMTRSALGGLTIGGSHLVVPPAPKTAQECQNTLDALLRVARDYPSPGSGDVVLLIDEFQRIGELGPKKRVEVCDALHLVFNSHPQGLRLVLAFAGGLPEIIELVLTPDLQSRVSARLGLPSLSRSEGYEYLVSLVEAYGHLPISERPGDGGVFISDAVEAILSYADSDGAGLSPRAINLAGDILTNEVLNERDLSALDPEAPITAGDVRAAAARVAGDTDT